MWNCGTTLPEFILLILPPKTEAFPGKPELGQGLDGTDSLLEVETVLFLVFTPIAKKVTITMLKISFYTDLHTFHLMHNCGATIKFSELNQNLFTLPCLWLTSHPLTLYERPQALLLKLYLCKESH